MITPLTSFTQPYIIALTMFTTCSTIEALFHKMTGDSEQELSIDCIKNCKKILLEMFHKKKKYCIAYSFNEGLNITIEVRKYLKRDECLWIMIMLLTLACSSWCRFWSCTYWTNSKALLLSVCACCMGIVSSEYKSKQHLVTLVLSDH